MTIPKLAIPPKPLTPPSRPPSAWVAQQLSVLPVDKALCMFNGWGADARALRQLGWSIATSDLLQSSFWWNQAFIAEDSAPLCDRRLNDWLKLRKEPEIVKRFLSWANLHFTPEESIWLGIWYQHLLGSELPPSERAIGVVAVYWTLRYWLTWNRQELGFKPMPPSALFRHYVGQANRMIRGSRGRSHGVDRLAPEAALIKHPSDLLYCYVPPCEGIGILGQTQPFWEQWTQGITTAVSSPFKGGALGGVFSQPEEHLAAVASLLEASEAFPYVALSYQGNLGPALEAMVAQRRPIMAREELPVPYPTAEGSSIIVQGILVAGR